MVINSIWVQLANLGFVFAAIFSDILLIRFCLVMGNFFIMLSSALGWPLWPALSAAPNVAVDSLVWSAIAFVLHLYALIMLLLDERRVRRFPDDSSERLFQFFSRRTGIRRRDFVQILSRGKWTRVEEPNTIIPTDRDFHLIVEGNVDCEIEGWRRRDDDDHIKFRTETFKVTLGSGEVFDLRLANVFQTPIGFFNTSFAARTTCRDVLLFSWSYEDLQIFAQSSPPVVTQAWRNLIAFAVADIAHRPWVTEDQIAKPPKKHHVDFELPAKEKEISWSLKEYLLWILRSMDPRPPPGLRHAAIPVLSITASAALLRDPRLSGKKLSYV